MGRSRQSSGLFIGDTAVEEWTFTLTGYSEKRVKSFEFDGTLGDLGDALVTMTSWRRSTGANLAIVPLEPRSEGYEARPTQGAWLVQEFPIPGSTALMTITAVELRPAGKTRVECYDGFRPDMPSATSLEKTFDEFVAELSKRLKVVGGEAEGQAGATEAEELEGVPTKLNKQTKAQQRALEKSLRAKQLRAQGKTRGQIASELGVSLRTVDRYLDLPSE